MKMCTFLCILLLPIMGCAVQYVDNESDTVHLFGIGHMKVKVSELNEGVRAIVTGSEVLGVNFMIGGETGSALSVGFTGDTKLRVTDNTSVRLDWPNRNIFDIHVGTIPPFNINNNNKEK